MSANTIILHSFLVCQLLFQITSSFFRGTYEKAKLHQNLRNPVYYPVIVIKQRGKQLFIGDIIEINREKFILEEKNDF